MCCGLLSCSPKIVPGVHVDLRELSKSIEDVHILVAIFRTWQRSQVRSMYREMLCGGMVREQQTFTRHTPHDPVLVASCEMLDR